MNKCVCVCVCVCVELWGTDSNMGNTEVFEEGLGLENFSP
jgi:hypothetical protein